MVWKYLWRKRSSLTPGEAASKRRVTIFALCIVFSALFWLFSKLSQENSASFNIHVHFNNFPTGLVAASQSDVMVQYSIETTGIRLLKAYFFRPTDTLMIPVDGLPIVQRQGRPFYAVTDNQLFENLSEKIEGSATVSNIRPDTIFLELVPAKRKKLPVRLNANIRYAQRFRSYGSILVEPDSVWITGPQTIIDTLQYVSTANWESPPLRETKQITVQLQKPAAIKSIELGVQEVLVEVPVAEFTESSMELPVVINCPGDYATSEVRLFPNTVRVSYLVALHDYATVVPQMFQVSVVCPQVQQTADGRLEVAVEKHPPFVDVIAVKPSFVEYIILE